MSFFLRFDELETCGAFVGGRAGGSALGGLAAVNEDILIALESANASFKKGNTFGIKDMSGVTGTMVIQTRKWEDVLAKRTNGKRNKTGGTHSLVGVSGRTNMCSHAGFAAEVAYMKFDEGTVFTVRLNTSRVRGLLRGVTTGS